MRILAKVAPAIKAAAAGTVADMGVETAGMSMVAGVYLVTGVVGLVTGVRGIGVEAAGGQQSQGNSNAEVL